MLSGVVLIPVVVYIVLFAPSYWTLAVSTLITFLALTEFGGLGLHKRRDKAFDVFAAVTGAAIGPLAFLCPIEYVVASLVALVFAYFAWALIGARELQDSSLDVTHKALGLVYLAVPLAFLTPLTALEDGRWWLLFLLVVIWSNDTFAYFTGRAIGSHKLAPVISPKKTVEGAVGGIVGGALAGVVFAYFAALDAGPLEIVAITVVVGVVAMAGDLAESLLKRGAGVKDSGSIIPGHGGVLDRIDSLVFAVPLMYFYLASGVCHA